MTTIADKIYDALMQYDIASMSDDDIVKTFMVEVEKYETHFEKARDVSEPPLSRIQVLFTDHSYLGLYQNLETDDVDLETGIWHITDANSFVVDPQNRTIN